MKKIIQVGMRLLSSAGRKEVNDAKAWGVNFFPAYDVHDHGVTRKAKIRAFAFVELVPAKDPDGLGALTAGRIVNNAIGAVLRR